jgi:hypothetical protein
MRARQARAHQARAHQARAHQARAHQEKLKPIILATCLANPRLIAASRPRRTRRGPRHAQVGSHEDAALQLCYFACPLSPETGKVDHWRSGPSLLLTSITRRESLTRPAEVQSDPRLCLSSDATFDKDDFPRIPAFSQPRSRPRVIGII